MQFRQFENWSASRDSLAMPVRSRQVDGVNVDLVERATFCSVWTRAAQRVGLGVVLTDEVYQ